MNEVDIVRMQAVGVQAFDRVANRCEGLVAVSWLAGEGRTFDKPFRRFGDIVRPTALVLEVTQNDGLSLSVAVCYPRNGVPTFETIGCWDFRAPITPRGRNAQMNLNKPKHRLNARRACDMLHAICDFGYADRRGEDPQLEPARWPRVMIPFPAGAERIDEDRLSGLALRIAPEHLFDITRSALRKELVTSRGKTVFVDAKIALDEDVSFAVLRDRAREDFTPVLGALDRNPFINGVDSLVVSLPNPAAKILRRRGIVAIDNHTSQMVVDDIAMEIRMTMPEMTLSEEEVAEAILAPDEPMRVSVDVKTALETMPEAAAESLRFQASKRAQKEATDQELFTALANPSKPLVLNRLSAVQVNDIATWQNPPRPYAGDLLAPIDLQHADTFHVQPVETSDAELV
jgi:hypothetical protein